MDSSERPQDVVPGQSGQHPPMPAPQQPQIPPCATCGGQRVGGLNLVGKVGLHPMGKTLWLDPLSELNAVVCLGCGLTSFYATHLAAIRDEAQKSPATFRW